MYFFFFGGGAGVELFGKNSNSKNGRTIVPIVPVNTIVKREGCGGNGSLDCHSDEFEFIAKRLLKIDNET